VSDYLEREIRSVDAEQAAYDRYTPFRHGASKPGLVRSS
jgi:hypothetical protein